MTDLFKKLNFKGQEKIFVLNARDSFQAAMEEMRPFTQVKEGIAPGDEVEFVIAFALTQREVNEAVERFGPHLKGDATVWMVYAKGSSKLYKCEFNRDTGWDILGKYGLEGVRQVAIDEDWSALRFRKIDYIKNLSRKFDLLSEKYKREQEKEK